MANINTKPPKRNALLHDEFDGDGDGDNGEGNDDIDFDDLHC